jgi:hypothetical protein
MNIKNKSGFISIQTLFIVLLISSAVFSYGYIAYAQKQKDAFRKSCFYDLVDIQKSLVQSEKKLFLLNPQSTALRLRLQFLYLVLAAAIASENPPLIVKTLIDIKNTEALQQNLDKMQKLIILNAEAQLHAKMLKLSHELNMAGLHEKSIWSYLLIDYRTYHLKQNVRFAVRPDSAGGTAPNYELQNNYKELQKLSLILHHSFSNNVSVQKYFNTQKTFKYICEVSFKKESEVWQLEINQGKLL